MQKIDEMIEVLQAAKDRKPIECRKKTDSDWNDMVLPVWNWVEWEYRVKPEPTYREPNLGDVGGIVEVSDGSGVWEPNVKLVAIRSPDQMFRFLAVSTSSKGFADSWRMARIKIESEPNEKPEPREFWVNEYQDGAADFIYLTREKADREQAGNRIRCFRVREVLED